MRGSAVIAAAILTAVLFSMAGKPSVNAALSNQQNQVRAETKAVEPPKEVPFHHRVKRGDTLVKIAKQYETTVQRLFDANPDIKDPNIIYPDQKIRIPNEDEQLEARTLPKTNYKKSAPKSTRAKTYVAKASVRTSNAGVWDKIAQCESGGNWRINTGNGYFGGLQFSLSSWRGVGGKGYPHQASKAEQIKRAKMLLARQGWGAWPACTKKLGIR